MTFDTPICFSASGSAWASPGGKAIAPVATIVPWPGISRGTEATVPMPPGLVSVIWAPW